MTDATTNAEAVLGEEGRELVKRLRMFYFDDPAGGRITPQAVLDAAALIEQQAAQLAAKDEELANEHDRVEELSRLTQEYSDDLAALIAEYESQAAKLAAWQRNHRWNIEEKGGDLIVCRGDHEKYEGCEPERFVPAAQLAAKDEELAQMKEALVGSRVLINSISSGWVDEVLAILDRHARDVPEVGE